MLAAFSVEMDLAEHDLVEERLEFLNLLLESVDLEPDNQIFS